jgi:hypothetical protein
MIHAALLYTVMVAYNRQGFCEQPHALSPETVGACQKYETTCMNTHYAIPIRASPLAKLAKPTRSWILLRRVLLDMPLWCAALPYFHDCNHQSIPLTQVGTWEMT